MSWTRRWTRSLTVATLGLGGATALAAWTLWRAVTVGQVDGLPVRPSAGPTGESSTRPPVRPSARPATPPALRQAAVQANPFRPERAPPTVAFRMPTDPEATPSLALQDRPGLVLIGTAVMPGNRGFALCQVGGEAPKLVRLGEQVGGYTLKTVAQGSATFLAANGTTLDVAVPKAGSLRAN